MICSDLSLLRKEIHHISWNYHWQGDYILSLSALDRSEYIKLINEQIERENGEIKGDK